jgi:hypothetical protein
MNVDRRDEQSLYLYLKLKTMFEKDEKMIDDHKVLIGTYAKRSFVAPYPRRTVIDHNKELQSYQVLYDKCMDNITEILKQEENNKLLLLLF